MPSHQQQQTPQQETEAASIMGVELPDVGAMWSDFSSGWSNANDAAAMAAMQNSVGNAALYPLGERIYPDRRRQVTWPLLLQ